MISKLFKPAQSWVAVLALIFSIVVPIASAPSASAYSTSAVSNTVKTTSGGGSPATADCASGSVLYRLDAKLTTYSAESTVTYLSGACASLTNGVTLLAGTGSTTSYGGNAGSAISTECGVSGSTQVIVGARVYKTSIGMVAGIRLECGTLPSGSSPTFLGSLMGVDTSANYTAEDLHCTSGTVALGIDVSYGSILDKFGLRCGTVSGAVQTMTASVSPSSANYSGSAYTSAVTLSNSGAAGSGAVTYTVADGTASGCSYSTNTSTGTLTASSIGTCIFTATKAADSNFTSTTATTTFTFNNASPTIASASISGSYVVGQTLTASAGAVTGGGTSLSYQWASSTSAAGTYTNISGATSSTYVLTSSEGGKYLKVTITATNNVSSASATSTASSKIAYVLGTVTSMTAGVYSGYTSNSVQITYSNATNASSHTALVYLNDGTTLVTSVSNYVSASRISGLSPSTTYKVTIKAIGDGVSFVDGPENTKVTVTTNSAAGAPTISSHPANASIVSGSTTSFSVSATVASGTLSYQWKTSPDGSTWTNVGTNSSSYTTSTLYGTSSGLQVKVTVTNTLNNTTSSTDSNAATITISPAALSNASAPTLTSTSSSVVVTFSSVANASSYTVRLYAADGVTQVGSNYTNFTSGSSITGLNPGTTFKATVQAIGSGINYATSSESALSSAVSTLGGIKIFTTDYNGGLKQRNLDGNGAQTSLGSVSSGVELAAKDSYVYIGYGAIRRIGVDGSGLITLRTVADQYGLEVNGSYIYYGYEYGKKIGRMSLDGSNANDSYLDFSANSNAPYTALLQIVGTTIYFGGGGNVYGTKIWKVDVSGGTPTACITDNQGISGIASDGTYIYWSNYRTGTIGRASLDCSGANASWITGVSYAWGIDHYNGFVYFNHYSGAGYTGKASTDLSYLNKTFATNYSTQGIAISDTGDGTTPLLITTPNSGLTGTYNSSYSLAVSASGGVGTKTYSVTGTLPAGLSINSSTGTISGTPTATGNSTITVTVTDSANATATTSSFTISIPQINLITGTPTVVVTSGSESTAITVTYSAYTNSSNSTNNASSFTVRVYLADGTTLVGSARTNFVSGTSITGLTPGTLYKVTLQAIGDGTNVISSSESSPSAIFTYPSAGVQLISHKAGRALHASDTWGQTFKTPVGTAGDLLAISNLHFHFRAASYIGVIGAKIYTSVAKSTLLGTATNTCEDTNANSIYPNGAYPDFNGPDCSFAFTGVTLSENTTYYFEVYRISGGSTFYLWETYDGEGSPYADGDVYLYGQSTPTATYDLKFEIVIQGAPPVAPTLTGAGVSGNAAQGQVLTAAVQGAGGGTATSTGYQWKSSTDNSTFTNISGATSSTYTLTSSEVNKYVQVVITVSNGGGSNSATSTAVGPIAAAPTISSISPTSGSTAGGTVVTINGTNFRSGATVRFGANNGTSVTVVSSTQITATSPSGSAGAVNIIVTNSDSITVTSSGAFTYVAAPTLTGAAISGTTTLGQTLTASVQGAGGGAATTTTYQWRSSSDNSTYTDISGATSSTYTLTSSESNKYIKVVITVSNVGGSNSATSSATSQIGIPALSNASAPTLTLTTGSETSSISVAFTSVTNASSYTVRVYQSDGTTLVGSARTNFSSGSAVSGLASGVTYKVSVQAIGDGVSYGTSAESSKASATTTSTLANLTITQNTGTAQYANTNFGQTFKVPLGTSGDLVSISNMHMAFRGTYVGTLGAKLYTNATKSTLLATSSDICTDSDSSLGGQIYADFNGPDCTFNFTGITLAEDTTYYFEISRLTGGSTFYLWQYLATGGTLYPNGQMYQAGTAYADWDLKFTINYLGTPPAAPTLTGVGVSGTTTQGQTLTAAVQGAGGGPAATTTYQWSRSSTVGGTYSNISGATSSTYVLTSTDVGSYLKAKITVTNAGGSNNSTSSATAIITGPSITPTVTSVSKNAGTTAGGNSVTITGTNLATVTSVTFGGAAATISSKTSTSVVVVAPAGSAGAVNVVVTNPAGSATSTNGYTYVTAPTTRSWSTSVSRTTASPGDSFTVTYTAVCTTPQTYGPSMYDLIYHNASVGWTFNTYMGSGTSTDGGYTWTITKTYTLPNTNNVIYKIDAYERGACWDSYNFTYAAQKTINVGVGGPAITSLNTTSGPTAGGTAVTITGTTLTGVTGITVGGVSATSIRSNTSTSVTFNVPAGTAGAKDVVVTTPAGSATSSGAFTYIAPSTITYNVNTADSGTPSRTSDSYSPNTGGYSLPTVGTMVKTGYTFGGWATANNSSTPVTNPYNPQNSLTLYAIWTVNNYSTTYNANGATSGTVPNSTSNAFGATVTVANNTGSLARIGYTLAGWNTLANGTGTSYILNSGQYTQGASNLILYADWVPNTYTVSYDVNGSNDAAPSSHTGVLANGTVTLRSGITKSGYAFVGWTYNSVTYAAGASFTIGSADAQVVAKWIAVYTLSYNLNGTGASGTVPADFQYADGNNVIVDSGTPTRSGYTFGGWKDQSNVVHAAGSNYNISSTNYLLYAVWTPVAYTVTYALNGGAGTAPTESSKNINDTFVVASAPTKTGYTFTGWSNGSTVYGAGSTYLVATSNITLTAQWSANSYAISYDLAQGTSTVPSGVSKAYQASWTLPDTPTRVGYTFADWYDGTSGYAAGATYTLNSANDLTLTARWTAIVYYTVTYDLDGGLGTAPTQDPLQNGQSFNLAADPSKTGNSFAGWSYAGATYTSGSSITMPASNITITALWTATSAGTYAITYISNGAQTAAPTVPSLAQNATFVVDDGSTLIKNGYVFSGWSYGGNTYNGGETITMPAASVTLSAIWVPSVRATAVSQSVDSTSITRGRSITVTYSLGCYYYSNTIPSITENVTSTGESFINDISGSLTVVDAGYNWTVTRVYTLSFAGTYTIFATASGGCFVSSTNSSSDTVTVTEAQSNSGGGSGSNNSNSSTGTSTSTGTGTGSVPPVTVVGAKIALVANKFYTLPKLAPKTNLSVEAKTGASASTTSTSTTNGNILTTTTMLSVNSASKGLSEVKIVENQLAVVPTVGFSGNTSVTVTVTDGATTSQIQVPVTVLPEAVKDPTLTPKTGTSTVVTWDASPNATNYQVFVDGKAVCKTSGESCTVPKILGPNANVDVVANGGDATKSEVADANYKAAAPVTITKISGTYGNSTLSKNDITNLNKVIATVNKQGFDNVQITNITTTKLTATAAKARVDAMVNYIKSKIDNPDLVVTVVAPTTRTFTNQIAVK